MSGIRINELRLGGLPGTDKTYGASFRGADGGGFRPLSVIAGPSLTGKTTIVDFIMYCLGDKSHPQKDEVRDAVRSAYVEVELDGRATVLERSATGEASKFALVWEDAALSTVSETQSSRYLVEPTSDPEGYSQYLLAACNLDNILLPDSTVKDETATVLLSIRDLYDVMFVPNERLDNKNLVFEQSPHSKRQKFRQTVDAIFGVHDNQDVILQRRYTNAREEANNAKARAQALRGFAEEEHPRGPAVLATDLTEADALVVALTTELATLDQQQSANQQASSQLRTQLIETERAARDARVRVRDRESLLARLDALRAQYADDQRKLNFLLDAERLFDPLHVTTCPVCFNHLDPEPTVEDGTCSLCHHAVPTVAVESASPDGGDDAEVDISSADSGPAEGEVGGSISTAATTDASPSTGTAALADAAPVIAAELRNVNKRLKSLNEYATRSRVHLNVLTAEQIETEARANAAASAVDAITTSPAPWIAARDRLSARIADAQMDAQAAKAGSNVWQRVADADDTFERLDRQAKAILAQRRSQKARPDRNAVISSISKRFGEILGEIQYPKLSNPMIADDLVPHVRNHPYTEASSGGVVLVGLAWNLAVWEVAHETGADAPGLLVIDSPQKNLGHDSKDDADFADTTLVENFYRHVKTWLAGDGAGAQLIVVDNSPPEIVADDVVIRFTRNSSVPPYGLIPEATG